MFLLILTHAVRGRSCCFLCCLCKLLVFYLPAHCFAIDLVSPTTQIEIEREQQVRLEEVEKAKKFVEQLQPTPLLPETSPKEEARCFEVSRVRFSGNTIFTSKELQEKIDFKPTCIGLNGINEYLRVITNFYVNAGYVTSRAYLVPQDLNSGILDITLIEGRVEALLFNGEPTGFLNNAIPNLVGKVLNLRDIEQGLEQINRLPRYNAQIKLPPGSQQGFSIVDIRSQENRVGSAFVGVANSGQESTGETQISFNLGVGNILEALDSWTLSGSKSSEFRTSKDAQSVSLSVDIPWGYWNVNYRTSYSDYLHTINNNAFKFESTGRTNNHDLDAKWLFYRDGESKSAIKFGVHHRREKNYILGNLLSSGSRNLSSVSLSLDYSTRLASGIFTIAPRFVLGTDWFGGEEDNNKGSSSPRAQFNKATLTASYSYSMMKNTSLSSTLFGQWSDDPLYGSQRLSIGGLYSVRGFKDISISGDQGYYWRNDLTYQFGKFPYIGSLSGQLALDTGSIVKDSKDRLERGSLLGSNLGLKTRSAHFSSDLSIGVPLQSPSRLNVDDYVIYYQLNVAL